jgi:hypothetical protein
VSKIPSSESCQRETLRQEPEPENLDYLNLCRSVKRNVIAACPHGIVTDQAGIAAKERKKTNRRWTQIYADGGVEKTNLVGRGS